MNKLEIIHLSDFHIDNIINYDNLVNSLIDCFTIKDNEDIFKKIFFCISGDISNAGQKESYDSFEKLFKMLFDKLIDIGYEPVLLFVPGNHDINFKDNNYPNQKYVHSLLYNKSLDKLDELATNSNEYLHNFFKFAKNYCLFTDNNFICEKYFDINDKKITFTLINTTAFSSLQKDDKDVHYIPKQNFSIVNNNCDFRITIMHHSLEWFNENNSDDIENILRNSSFYLYGHQHKSNFIKKENSIGFLANEFKIDNLSCNRFNIFLINIDSDEIEQIDVYYDDISKKYCRNRITNTFNLNNILLKNKIKEKHVSLIQHFKISTLNGDFNLNDVFVFPILTNSSNSKKIINIDQILSEAEKGIVCLSGQRKSGKSTLLQFITLNLIDSGKFVIYNNSLNITNNPDRIIKNLFEENYNDIDYNFFCQTSNYDKALIIDNFLIDDSNKTKKFLDYCKKNFGIVIISTQDAGHSIDENIIFTKMNEITFLYIQPFLSKQRNELIRKYCTALQNDENISDVENFVNNLATRETFFDLSNPDLLTTLIVTIAKDFNVDNFNSIDTFSEIFILSIKNALLEKCSNNIDYYLNVLSEIAYYMFKNNTYLVRDENILKINNDFKLIYGISVKFNELLNCLIDTRILYTCEDGYIFSRESVFSYFVADRINKRDTTNERENDFNYLTNNICFGNNGDILLFLAYFLKSTVFFEKLLLIISDKTKNLQAMSFEEKNVYILELLKNNSFNHIEYIESKKEYEERINKSEENFLKNNTPKPNKINYSEKKNINNSALEIFKLLEVLSKGISGYPCIITLDLRKRMIDTLYVCIYKLLYLIFNLSEKNVDDIYETLKKYLKNDNNFNKNNFNEMIFGLLMSISVNIIFSFTRQLISNLSMPLINSIDDTTFSFDTFIFKLLCYFARGDTKKFVDYLTKNFSKINKFEYKKIVGAIFAKYIILMNVSNKIIVQTCEKINVGKEIFLSLNS